jgi:hypothetical protein
MASIRRQRKPDFSYDYGEYLKFRPMLPVNRPGGGLGRSQGAGADVQQSRAGSPAPNATGMGTVGLLALH